ncbi:hypothetical protein IFM89_030831 [Coptis chinensis]|uniref:SUN domain-containing protein n=1 Tax=Coptis chinensis TaxID=261450 RepID=A0A835IJ53_9MAGN|nr:hypothetical protein IFM89_030831 [Coptis chinensis]
MTTNKTTSSTCDRCKLIEAKTAADERRRKQYQADSEDFHENRSPPVLLHRFIFNAHDRKPRWRHYTLVSLKFLLVLAVLGFICFTFVYYCEQYKLLSSEIPDICQVSSDECFIKNLQKSMKLTQDSVGSLEIELEQIRKRCLFLESLLEKFLTTDGNYNVLHSNTGFMNDSGMTHDEIQASSLEVIGGMMEKFQGGDYASVSSGGMVVAHSERWFSDRDTIQKGILFTDPRKILETSSGDPNECFCMKGSGGFVDIRVGTPVIPESITLEHFVIKVASVRSTAPKTFRVSAWHQEHDVDLSALEEKYLLAEFLYDLERRNAQTFVPSLVDRIRLNVDSNHGGSGTCICRVKVHGHQPDSVA